MRDDFEANEVGCIIRASAHYSRSNVNQTSVSKNTVSPMLTCSRLPSLNSRECPSTRNAVPFVEFKSSTEMIQESRDIPRRVEPLAGIIDLNQFGTMSRPGGIVGWRPTMHGLVNEIRRPSANLRTARVGRRWLRVRGSGLERHIGGKSLIRVD